jgi:hypothetical protein
MGIVYILTNDSMPGIIKMGITDESIQDRMKSLDNTSIPTPFRFYFAIEDDRYKEIEKLVHNTFADYRIRQNREFFKVDPERAVSALKISGGKELKLKDDMINEDGKIVEEKIDNPNRGKDTKRFQFEKYGIPIGSELVFVRDEEKKCIVLKNNNVSYNGKEYSISGLAKMLINEMGYNWKTANGPNFFEYNDILVSDIYKKYKEEI